MQPALAGPGLDQGEAGLGVVEDLRGRVRGDDELWSRDGAVAEVALHQRRVEAEVGRGEQADRAGALQVAVELEQVDGRRAVLSSTKPPVLILDRSGSRATATPSQARGSRAGRLAVSDSITRAPGDAFASLVTREWDAAASTGRG